MRKTRGRKRGKHVIRDDGEPRKWRLADCPYEEEDGRSYRTTEAELPIVFIWMNL